MKGASTFFYLLLIVVLGSAGFLFWSQNRETVVDLVFRLPPVGGWYLARATPVPVLLVAAFGIGALGSALLVSLRGMAAARRTRTLQRQVQALQDELDFHRRTANSPRPAQSPSGPVGPSSNSAVGTATLPRPLAPVVPAAAPVSSSAPAPASPVAVPPRVPSATDYDDIV